MGTIGLTDPLIELSDLHIAAELVVHSQIGVERGVLVNVASFFPLRQNTII